MPHRAALYAVTIHRKQDPATHCILGDYNNSGKWLGKTMKKLMPNMSIRNTDRSINLHFETKLNDLPKDHIGFTFLRGQTGVTSVLSRPNGPIYHRTPVTEESLRIGAVFWLPRRRNKGYLAIHVAHRGGIKSDLERFLREKFAPRGYVLSLKPIVPQNVLQSAVRGDKLEKITLVKWNLSESDQFSDAAQWGDEEVGRIEFSIISKRGWNLRSGPLQRFLSEKSDKELNNIIEFEGMQFDEAKVTAKMPGGNRRTFYLDGRESGHAITIGLDLGDNSRTSDSFGILPELLRDHLVEVLSQVPTDS